MNLKVKLLILALMTSLISPGLCEKDFISGDGTAETNESEEMTSIPTHSPAVTDLQVETEHTVYIQKDDTKHEKSDAQVSLARVTSVTPMNTTTSPKTLNGTQKQNNTLTTGGTVKKEPVNRNNTQVRNSVVPTQSKSTEEKSEVTHAPKLDEDVEDPYIFIIIVVSLVLSLVLTAIAVAAVLISHKRRKEKAAAEKEDLYLETEGTEKVPMPMFEDDVPSVMELEMEDLEKWMIKGDGGISMNSRQL